ncbi:hypothetical protein D3C78_549240 [compost metagenome]
MTRIEYITRRQVEVDRDEIAGAVDRYLAAGGQITILDGFQHVEQPKPSFNGKIDPATILKRRRNSLSISERQKLRKLAEAL